MRVKVIMII